LLKCVASQLFRYIDKLDSPTPTKELIAEIRFCRSKFTRLYFITSSTIIGRHLSTPTYLAYFQVCRNIAIAALRPRNLVNSYETKEKIALQIFIHDSAYLSA